MPVARSSTPATASWRRSARRRRRSPPPCKSKRRSPPTMAPARFPSCISGSASTPASRSPKAATSSAQPCSWRRGSAPRPEPMRSWCRAWCGGCAPANRSASKRAAVGSSRAFANRSRCSRWLGNSDRGASGADRPIPTLPRRRRRGRELDAIRLLPPPSLRPRHRGRQAHQDRLDIAAGLEAEQGAAIVEQVELDIAAAAHQLRLAFGGGPGLVHVPADQARIDLEEGGTHLADEGEIALPVAGVEIVEEDAADAARLAAMGKIEIVVAPLLEARVVAGVVAAAGGSKRLVKHRGVALVRHHRRQIGAAAEPALGGEDVPRVH